MKRSVYQQRIQKALKRLKSISKHAVLVIGSTPQQTYSRDQYYSYRQDSDYYYLTGTPEPVSSCIILRADADKPILIGPEQTESSIIWDGKTTPLKNTARSLGAKYVCAQPVPEVISTYIRDCDHLVFQNRSGSPGLLSADYLLRIPSHSRQSLPESFSHSDVILEPMRLYKTADEIALIKKAAEITARGFEAVAENIRPGMKEYQVAALCEYHYKDNGGDVAFQTIAGSGASAATLHYSAHTQTLRKGEMLLLDSGASYQYYAADVTRCFPVGGAFTPLQSDLYDCVNEALEAALKTVRDGVKIQSVYTAAAKVLTLGLKDFGILKGSLSSLMEKKAYRKYFPHGIGHSLGLDVHDIGKLRANNKAILKKGMVFTVEPGLYFPKKTGKIPACGIRIEDDIVVTATGHKNLTKHIPR